MCFVAHFVEFVLFQPRTLRWVLAVAVVLAASLHPYAATPEGVVTSFSEFRTLRAAAQMRPCPIHLEGTIYFLDAAGEYLVLGDEDGFADFEIDPPDSALQFGDRVALDGVAELGGAPARLRRIPTIDNDGLHGVRAEQGTLQLNTGYHRFELEFFQRTGGQALLLNWMGPGVAQQPLLAESLFQRQAAESTLPAALQPGVDFACYRGAWERLPQFGRLQPVRAGTTTNFDPQQFRIADNFGLRLTAWLRITNDGIYTFELSSDDGSKLFLDSSAPALVRLGKGTVLPPRRLDADHPRSASENEFVEVEGVPEFIGAGVDEIRFQLRHGPDMIEALMCSGGSWHPTLLANSTVRLQGVLQRTLDASGRTNGQRLLIDGATGVRRVSPIPSLWQTVPPMPLRALAALTHRSPLVHAAGRCTGQSADSFLLTDQSGELAVIADPPARPQLGDRVEVLGRLQRVSERVVIMGAVLRPVSAAPVPGTEVLTTLDQVYRLSRAQVRLERPLDVTAVTVLSKDIWLFVRDASRSIYLTPNWPTRPLPKVGEVYRIEGHTAADLDGYTPFVYPSKTTFRGRAPLPEPLHPSWAELMTGSLDAQWVELEGVASSVSSNRFVLTTAGGKLETRVLSGRVKPEELEGALVRVRGCCSVSLGASGQIAGILMLVQSWDFISVAIPAPTDPFALARRSIGALLSYDADATRLRYMKVTGTILHNKDDLFFLTDGTNSVRFVTKKPEPVRAGDAVEVVGILDAATQAPAQVEKTHQELLIASREAGMAEVATSVLHNVGNVLNSVTVSAGLLKDQVNKSKATSLAKAVALLRQHEADLGAFLTQDPKGKQLPGYLGLLSEHLASEQAAALVELGTLSKSVEHITRIVVMQQRYGTVSGVLEPMQVPEAMEDALRMSADGPGDHAVRVVRDYADGLSEILVDRHKMVQILVNLIRNARYACGHSDRTEPCLTVRVIGGENSVVAIVEDNGVGIAPENLTRIFNQGFTTRKDGHGYGLHSGALAAREMGGSLTVHSDGPGQGATFTLELPVEPRPRKT